MGKLLIFAKYYFFIWAGEDPNERLYVHIYRTDSKNVKGAKFWLDDLFLFDRGDFNARELNQIEKDLQRHLLLVKSQVKKVLSREKVKAIKIR